MLLAYYHYHIIVIVILSYQTLCRHIKQIKINDIITCKLSYNSIHQSGATVCVSVAYYKPASQVRNRHKPANKPHWLSFIVCKQTPRNKNWTNWTPNQNCGATSLAAEAAVSCSKTTPAALFRCCWRKNIDASKQCTTANQRCCCAWHCLTLRRA